MSTLLENLRQGVLPPPPAKEIANALGELEIEIAWLAGDGSDRCYYRVKKMNSDETYVLMQLSGQEAVALKDEGYEWIDMASLLNEKGICIPKVVATMPDYAALIIEDYGDMMLETFAHTSLEYENFSSELKQRYLDAIQITSGFLKITNKKDHVWSSRAFDKERLVWELNFFRKKYLEPIARIELTPAEEKQFEKEVNDISEVLSSHSMYFVHRDFHSRNLMIFKEHLAVIDFQDARLGPPAYDIVSLLFDSYVPFSNKIRRGLLDEAIQIFKGQNSKDIGEAIEETWQETLIQRQLKAIGSFGYLTLDKNKGDYLKYVPLAAQTILDNANLEWYPLLSKEIPERIQHTLKV